MRHLGIALVAVAAQGCQTGGQLGGSGNDAGSFDVAGPGSGGSGANRQAGAGPVALLSPLRT
jgi:hypothetical protein